MGITYSLDDVNKILAMRNNTQTITKEQALEKWQELLSKYK